MPGNTSDNLASVLEAKGVKFNFHTGGVKYQAVLHKDRHSYLFTGITERMKAQAAGADSSVSSTSSTDSESSAGSSAKAAN